MTRIIRIESCAECPHRLLISSGWLCLAGKNMPARKDWDELKTIPDWCPLEKEEGK